MRRIFTLLVVFVCFLGCSKDDDPSEVNPFQNPALLQPPDTNKAIVFEKGSFQYLHHFIFKATCANSGCHDGNFEPDFRTVYSAYNTLVNHAVIKNNSNNDFKARVDPGNINTSVIIERLTHDIDGISGIMPLSVDADSDWLSKKDEYIQMIKDWIVAGAPDTYGNVPGFENLNPQIIGIMAFNTGNTTTPLIRITNSTSPIGIPNTPIDVWLALADDNTPVNSFKMTLLKSSKELFDFTNASDYNLSGSTPISGKDFWNNNVSFTHKATLVFPSDTIGTEIFLRGYLQDDVQEDTTIVPNDGSNAILRSYFTLKVDSL